MKINALTILFGTSLFFYSCEDKPELVSGIIKENMNLAAIPGNNFEHGLVKTKFLQISPLMEFLTNYLINPKKTLKT